MILGAVSVVKINNKLLDSLHDCSTTIKVTDTYVTPMFTIV